MNCSRASLLFLLALYIFPTYIDPQCALLGPPNYWLLRKCNNKKKHCEKAVSQIKVNYVIYISASRISEETKPTYFQVRQILYSFSQYCFLVLSFVSVRAHSESILRVMIWLLHPFLSFLVLFNVLRVFWTHNNKNYAQTFSPRRNVAVL